MTDQHLRPEVDFDPWSEQYTREGVDAERRMHDKCPVSFSSHYGGFWVVTGYDDLRSGLRDHETFSSEKTFDAAGNAYGGVTVPTSSAYKNVPEEVDPPEWNEYRRLLSKPFAPAAVRRMQPRIDAFTTEAIDRIIEHGQGDLILDIANPVTALITLDILGLPLADWEFYAGPIHRLAYDQQSDEVKAGMQACHDKLAQTVIERRERPQTGLTDDLIAARIGGEPLPDPLLVDMIGQILAGGLDTTGSLLGHAFDHLDRHRDDHVRLIEDEKFLQIATEEFLRWSSPVIGLARNARKSTVIHGQVIEPGDRLVFIYRAANRDPAVFDAPDDIVLTRFPNPHTAFGIGIHRCLGSNLARAVFQTVLRNVLRRMPDYRIDREQARQFPILAVANGWIQMPATFTPGPRLGLSPSKER
jgi:cytochrome P450